ncbi:unnamed protein product [Thlaspi arvense]|uniref:Ubiquitin-like protease family profile domain-containing protein n=1 Tax=Thlaspi arvense TaxID=13288 RepID=A0AAU9SG37_THLAR|nr:unnamed protein product [Thlaspi arvense]
MPPKRRIQLALFTIVDSVLIASAAIHRPTPKYARMLDDMESFLRFPWGKESFFHTIITTRPLRNGKHNDPNKVFCDQLLTGLMRVTGFPLILQIIAYRAIPLLAAKLPNISDETPLLEIRNEDSPRHRPISMDDIIEVENDPKVNQLEWLMAEMKERCEDIKKLQQQQYEMKRILKVRRGVETRQRSSQLFLSARKMQNRRRRKQLRKKNETDDGDGNMASLSFEVSLKEGTKLPRDWMEEPNLSPEKVEDRSQESGEMGGLLSSVGKKEGAFKRKRGISPSRNEREEKEELKMGDKEVGMGGSDVGEKSNIIGSIDEVLLTSDGEAAANMETSDKTPPAELAEEKIAAETKSEHAFADHFLASSPVQAVEVESRSSSVDTGNTKGGHCIDSTPEVMYRSSRLPGRAGTNVDTICISDCSAVSESTTHKPTEVERELALTLLAKQSRAPVSILPTLDVDIWKQFERTLDSCGYVKHLTRMGIENNNNFLLGLEKPMNWVNTKHIELLMSFVGEKHAEHLEKECACFAAPWLMDTIDIKHRSWKSIRNKKAYRWDDRLRHFVPAPGKTWIADVDTVYMPMIWLSKHLVGLVIDLKIQWVHILDPDPMWKDDKHVDKIMDPVLEFLPHIIRNLCSSHPSQPADPSPFTWHRVQNVYINKRSGDCGPVAMKFMEMHVLGDPAPHMSGITDEMVNDFRRQYAMDLYKKLVLPLYEEGTKRPVIFCLLDSLRPSMEAISSTINEEYVDANMWMRIGGFDYVDAITWIRLCGCDYVDA